MTDSARPIRSVQIDRYGPPEVLVLRPAPAPELAPDEVRIATVAAAVNRADLEIRSGAWPVQRTDPFPYTPGLEVLGDVVEVGSAVTGLAGGDRVITMMQRLGGIHGERPGGYAEQVVVRADVLASVPIDLDPFAMAALGLAAVTALEGVRRLEVAPGARVVVLGASGGVGSAAVSMATALGAQVTAVLPRPGKDGYVRSLGAVEVVHLSAGPLADQLGPRGVDAVLDTLGARTFPDSVAALRRGGRLCLVGALSGADLRLSAWDLMQELVLTGYSSENLTGAQLRADIAQLVEWVRAGRLQIPAYDVFALADAAGAHRRMEAGTLLGRALLDPSP